MGLVGYCFLCPIFHAVGIWPKTLCTSEVPKQKISSEISWSQIRCTKHILYHSSRPGIRRTSSIFARIQTLTNFFFFFSLRQSFAVAQAGVQWCNLGSLQLLPSGFKRFSCLGLQSNWDYRCLPPHPANFCIFRQGFIMLARLVSNSWPQVICPPQAPKVLGLQAWATVPGLYGVLYVTEISSPFSFDFFINSKIHRHVIVTCVKNEFLSVKDELLEVFLDFEWYGIGKQGLKHGFGSRLRLEYLSCCLNSVIFLNPFHVCFGKRMLLFTT